MVKILIPALKVNRTGHAHPVQNRARVPGALFNGICKLTDPPLNVPGSILNYVDEFFCQFSAAHHGTVYRLRQSGEGLIEFFFNEGRSSHDRHQHILDVVCDVAQHFRDLGQPCLFLDLVLELAKSCFTLLVVGGELQIAWPERRLD